MSLRKLVLNNFKSYPGKLEIPFDGAPFVAIAGPNGSGKSNLLDAVCFVAGIDTEQLRSGDANELVNSGTDPKDMYVTATIATKESSGSRSSEIEFKRTVSGYYIDGRSVTSEQFSRRWAQLQVLPSTNNCMILQGDVEMLAGADQSFLAKRLEDLQIAELPTSVEEEHKEYAQLGKEIELASADVREWTSKRRQAQSRADQAVEISETREKLAAMRKQLKQLKKRRNRAAIAEKRAMLAELTRRGEEAQNYLENCRSEASLANSDSRKLRSEYAKKRRQLLNARNAEVEAQEALASLEVEIAQLEKNQEPIEAEQRLLGPDLEFAQQLLASAEAEAETAMNALNALNREHEKEREQAEVTDSSGDLSKETRDLWFKLESEFTTESALEQDKLDRLRRQAEVSLQSLHNKTQRLEDIQADLNRELSRVQQREQRVQQLTALVEERTAQQEQRKAELQSVSDDLLALHVEQRDMTAELKKLSAKVRQSDSNKKALAQRHRLLDAVERLKRAQGKKVYDLLAYLIEPTEIKFSQAIETALGANADAIVVEDSETAVACIAQARRERLGTLTFLPLSDLRVKDMFSTRALLSRHSGEASNSRNGGGANQSPDETSSTPVARLIIDCANYNPKFRAAVVYAVGDSIFAESFDEGLKLRRSGLKMRIIDAHGSVIRTNNIMSASSGNDGTSSAASDRALASMQRKAHGLAEKLKANAARETEILDNEIRLKSKIDQGTQTIEGVKTELHIAEQHLQTAKAEAEYYKSLYASEKSSLEELEKSAESADHELELFMEHINTLRRAKFSPFLEKVSGDLSVWDSRFSENAQRYADFSKQRRRLDDRVKVALEHRDAAEAKVAQHKKHSRALQVSLDRVLEYKSRIESEAVAARHRLERAQARVRELRDETEAKSNEVGSAESAAEEAQQRVVEAEREEHRRALALAAEIGEDEARAKLDDEEDEDDSDSSDDNDNQTGSSTQQRASRKRKRNTSSARSKNSDKVVLSLDSLDASIRSLTEEIEPLARLVSLVNSGDQDGESSKASQKCADLDATADRARSRLDALVARFEELRKPRSERFNDGLRKLQEVLSKVYIELAGEGGQAKIAPVDTEKPFDAVEYLVMPPNKQFTHVSQLSGGERSMAALALLFALQKLYPAPFVVMDEIDAALDFNNVVRVARYITFNSSQSQFIVVSLKQRLFQTASHLVGVYKEKAKSHVLTVAL